MCMDRKRINQLYRPFAHTHPIPIDLAFSIARSMQNLPTTGPGEAINDKEI